MGHFLRHYLEMIASMIVGMGVLYVTGLGHSAAEAPELAAFEMALAMSAGMVAWMRYRGHRWAPTLEMVAAMFVPAIVLSPLSLLEVISGDMLMIATHVLMLPLMLVAMLLRRKEYAH